MHSSRKRASVFAAIVVIVVLALSITHALRKRANAEAAPTASVDESVVEFTPADLAAVTRHTLSETLPLTGSLRAVTQAAVKAKVAGSALDVRAREGDTVKAGQILATIDARDYAARADQSRGQMAAMAGQQRANKPKRLGLLAPPLFSAANNGSGRCPSLLEQAPPPLSAEWQRGPVYRACRAPRRVFITRLA